MNWFVLFLVGNFVDVLLKDYFIFGIFVFKFFGVFEVFVIIVIIFGNGIILEI